MSNGGKTAFITGVSSGIGHALAKEYLAQEWTVYGCSRREPEDLSAGDAFHFTSIDLSELDVIPDALNDLLESTTHIDLVVLNAGILGRIADMRDTSLEELKHLMDINLWSNKVILDHLYAKGIAVGQVIGISSGAAVNGNRGWAGYSISKAALNMLIKLYAREVPDTHFSAFAPGLVDTRMQDYLCDEVDDARFESIDRLRKARGTEKMPTPEKLAPKLVAAFDALRSHPTGAFIDIREM